MTERDTRETREGRAAGYEYPMNLTPHERAALMAILSDYITGAPRVEVSIDALTGDELTPGDLLRRLVQLDPRPVR